MSRRYVSRLLASAVSALLACTELGRIAATTVSQRGGVLPPNVTPKILADCSALAASVNPPRLPTPVRIITFLGRSQGTVSFLKRNQKHCERSRVCAIDRRIRMNGNLVGHIIGKNVCTRRLSCSGTVPAQQIAEARRTWLSHRSWSPQHSRWASKNGICFCVCDEETTSV
jgi:hypothetical protein